jgi:hypothetical protein
VETVTTSVIVPWRGGDPVRERLWAWNKARWQSTGYEIVECDDGSEPFTRGRSINRGVEEATGDRLILADTDTALSSLDRLENLSDYDLVKADRRGMAWYILYDHHRYCALTDETTDWVLRLPPSTPFPATVVDTLECRDRITSHSGLLMLSREAFDTVGGYDPGFCGWGYEDDAFWHALVTLVGSERRLKRSALHLYHPHIESERFDQPFIGLNRSISDSYAHLSGNVVEMTDFVRLRREIHV